MCLGRAKGIGISCARRTLAAETLRLRHHRGQRHFSHSSTRELSPNHVDAIHRALLSGLLGNVANKTDVYEYTGARGTKLRFVTRCVYSWTRMLVKMP